MPDRTITPSPRRRASGLVAALALALAGAVVACSPQGAGGPTQRLSVATGGTGGVYYPYGGGVAKVISDHLDGVEATAEVTAGTVDNLKFIANREADLAFALADSLDDAAGGLGVFAGFGAVPALAIAVLYDNLNQLVTLEGEGIEAPATSPCWTIPGHALVSRASTAAPTSSPTRDGQVGARPKPTNGSLAPCSK